ncbi:MAG: hypothetical protein ACI8RD_011532, partial [Bacillariaceae sp.]
MVFLGLYLNALLIPFNNKATIYIITVLVGLF